MNRTRLLIGGAIVIVLFAAPVGWYLISPLFITRAVNEAFPAARAAIMPQQSGDAMLAQSGNAAMSKTTEAVMTKPSDPAMAAKTEVAMMAKPSEVAMAAEPKLLVSGQFHPVTHNGTGTASIFQLPDGKRALRFENFEVLNGPDLYVYLAAAPDANDAATIRDGGFVSLGKLKGNKGNQNYELPADLDLSKYRSVSIWCRQFSVNFATAPLK